MRLTDSELHSQYDALAQTIGLLEREAGALRDVYAELRPRAVVFIGCGSSYMLCKSMAALGAQQLGIPVCALPAGDLWLNIAKYRTLLNGALIVALSRSGQTSEVVNAVRAAIEQPGVTALGIVCQGDTPLHKLSARVIELPWAFDHSVCQTRSVTNLYAAGAALLSLWSGDKCGLLPAFARAAHIGAAFLAENEGALGALAACGWSSAVVLADGELCGLAEEGALAFNEISQLPSNCYHILDVRHGPMVLIGEKTLVVVMLGENVSGAEKALVADLVGKGAQVVVCQMGGEELPGAALTVRVEPLPPAAAGALYISVCQLLAYHKSEHTGSDPDAPTGLNAWIEL